MVIRDAVESDFGGIINLAKQFTKLADEPFDEESCINHLEWLMGEDYSTVMVCEDSDGHIVGMVSGICAPVFWDESKKTAAELWWYVDPVSRGNGVGGLLLTGLEKWARNMGAWRLSMMSIGDATPGIEKLYESRGYAPKERTFVKELK